jgi:endonuclease/exonuclease/phosphatase family metal-dependent hydrolase
MKNLNVLLLGLAFVLLSCSKSTTEAPEKEIPKPETAWLEPLQAGSYNIEYDNENTPNLENLWVNRKLLVVQLFEKYSFDILGVQEPSRVQLNELMTLMPAYAFIGTDINGSTAVNKQLSTVIVYKKERIEVIKSGKFWFAENPEASAIGWDAYSKRICTWAFMKDKLTKKEFYFFSIHLDHLGQVAREKSVELLLAKIPQITGTHPFVLTGDFNFNQKQAPYQQITANGLLKDAFTLTSQRTNALRGTFNNYDPDRINDSRIDHIFVSAAETVKVNHWAIRTDAFNGKYPSDHFPVTAELSFSNSK